MAFTVPQPITGSAVTGLTTPTYTHVADTPPSNNGKQVYISALGGTQTGVDTHSVSKPFTLSMFRPAKPAVLGAVDPVTGALKNVPMNVYKVHGRKGVVPLAGQAVRNAYIKIEIGVPAGSDTADVASLKALHSMTLGACHAMANEIFETVRTGSV